VTFFPLFLAFTILTAGQPSPEQPLRIRHIYVNNLSVFDLQHAEFRWWGFRLTNRLHLKTRESFIRNELLLSEGDLFQADLLRESERNLRRYAFLTEVSIKPDRVSNEEVDLSVNTEDQWTTKPSFSLGKTRGARNVTIGIEEENFLGLGRTVGVRFEKDKEREGFSAKYGDPRFLNSRLKLNLGYSNLSDGHRLNYGINQPFYSQEARWSYGMQGGDTKRLQHFYYRGTDAAAVENVERFASLNLIRAWGERYKRNKVGVSLGYSQALYPSSVVYDEEAAQNEEIQKNLNPDEKELFNIGLNIVRDRQKFSKFYYLDNFGRTEDLPYGTLAGFSVVHSNNDSGLDFVTGSVSGRYSFQRANKQYFVSNALFSVRRQDEKWNNRFMDLSGHYYLQNSAPKFGIIKSPRQTIAANLSATWTADMDAPFQLSLGEDEGLRGYPFREFTGQNRALLNLEYRIFLPWENRFFGVSVVPFTDSGYVWNPEYNFGSSIGMGLRIGFKKYGRTRVLRIDYAYPLVNRKIGSISISAGQAFDVL
jgi:outer membrane protein assembly factor BamA